MFRTVPSTSLGHHRWWMTMLASVGGICLWAGFGLISAGIAEDVPPAAILQDSHAQHGAHLPLDVRAKVTGTLETVSSPSDVASPGETHPPLPAAKPEGFDRVASEAIAQEPVLPRTDLTRVTDPSALVADVRARGFRFGAPAFIRIFKQSNELEVWLAGADGRFELYRNYAICKWSGVLGPKLAEGDEQSPEGFYAIERWQLRPLTRNHRAIEVGFPNAFDRAHDRSGSHIQLHGGCGSIGCFAMTDKGIEEIYDLVDAALTAGQQRVPLHIYPFRMSDAALEAHGRSPWAPFWQSLQPAHARFEAVHRPAVVRVCEKAYEVGDQGDAQCVDPWHGTRRMYFAGSQRGTRPQIQVRCDLRRASCKRWLTLARRRQARGLPVHRRR